MQFFLCGRSVAPAFLHREHRQGTSEWRDVGAPRVVWSVRLDQHLRDAEAVLGSPTADRPSCAPFVLTCVLGFRAEARTALPGPARGPVRFGHAQRVCAEDGAPGTWFGPLVQATFVSSPACLLFTANV